MGPSVDSRIAELNRRLVAVEGRKPSIWPTTWPGSVALGLVAIAAAVALSAMFS